MRGFRKIVTICLSIALMITVLPCGMMARAEDSRGEIYSEGYSFAPHEVNEDLTTDSAVYSDSFFGFPASTENPHLASVSMAFASAGIGSQNALNEGAPEKQPQNAKGFLESLGFGSFAANNDFLNWADRDGNSFGVCAAAKQTVINGRRYTLFAFVPRNANYGAEWGGNVRIGDGSSSPEAEGFILAKERYVDFFKSYIAAYYAEHPEAPLNMKLWTAGYSRGAGAINIAAPYISDHSAELLPAGVSLDREDMYVYTFGTPRAALGGTGGENAGLLASYTFVHNYILDYDMTPMLAFEDYGFARYGTDHRLNTGYDPASGRDDPGNKAKMLSFLASLNPTLYNGYIADAGTYDPDKFMIYKFKGDGTLAVEPDFDNLHGLPMTLEGTLHERLSVVAALPGSREAYAVDYQPGISTVVKFFKGDYSQRPSLLISTVASHQDLKPVGAMIVAYYVCREASAIWEAAGDDEKNAIREELKGMLTVALALAEQQLPGYMGEAAFPAESFAKLKALVEEGVDETVLFNAETLAWLRETSGFLLMDLVGKVALFCGYTEDEIRELVGDNYQNGAPLLDFVTAFALDRPQHSLDLISINPDTGGFMFNWNCSQMSVLATIIGNQSQFVTRTHANEIIRSWLMAQDSYYSDNYNYSAYRTLSFNIPAEGAVLNIKKSDSESITVRADRNGIERNAPTQPFELDIYTNLKDGILSVTLPFGSAYEVSMNVGGECVVDSSVSEYLIDGTLSDRFVKGSKGESFTGLRLRSCDRLIYRLSDRTEAGIIDTAKYDVELIEIESPQTGDDAPFDLRVVMCLMLLSALGLLFGAGSKRTEDSVR